MNVKNCPLQTTEGRIIHSFIPDNSIASLQVQRRSRLPHWYCVGVTTPKRYRQLWVKDLSKVPTRQLEWGSDAGQRTYHWASLVIIELNGYRLNISSNHSINMQNCPCMYLLFPPCVPASLRPCVPPSLRPSVRPSVPPSVPLSRSVCHSISPSHCLSLCLYLSVSLCSSLSGLTALDYVCANGYPRLRVHLPDRISVSVPVYPSTRSSLCTEHDA